ncbi:MAG: aldehyde dehydrogenase family protein [Solirubrobacteraceae bacterium]
MSTPVLPVHSDVDGGRRTLEVRAPSSGAVVAEVPLATADDVARAAAELRVAQPAWEALGLAGRERWLARWRDWLLDEQERLTDLIQQETGKSRGDASIEVVTAAQTINYYLEHGAEFLADRRPRPHTVAFASKRLRLTRRPYPLVGVISPWNFPLALPAFDLIPALVAGCAVLSKPSEVVPLSWRAAVDGWEAIGAPPVLRCIVGDGEAGAAVVEHVDMVNFTGSTATGRRVAVRAAERLIPCSLELGGKDPMLVLRDADVERAAGAAVWGGLFNAGQACISVERVYVEAAVHDAFADAVVRRVAALRQGPEHRPFTVDVGAMANESQLSIVERHVQDALDRGARVAIGGRRRPGPGLFYEPTVLLDVDHDMACMREETFGPTLPIMRVPDERRAIELANDSPYGLSASVFSGDLARAEAVAARLEAGAVNINDVIVNGFQFPLPMGGWKQSGLGARAGGAAGIHKFCRAQATVSDRFEPRAEISWYPYTPLKAGIQGRALRLLSGRDLRRRLFNRSRGR